MLRYLALLIRINMSNISNYHILPKSCTFFLIIIQEICIMNKTALIALYTNKLFLTISIGIKFIKCNGRIHTQLSSAILAILHISTNLTIQNIFQHIISGIGLTSRSSRSYKSKMNLDYISHRIICSYIYCTGNKFRTIILRFLIGDSLERKIMLIKVALNVRYISHFLSHNLIFILLFQYFFHSLSKYKL